MEPRWRFKWLYAARHAACQEALKPTCCGSARRQSQMRSNMRAANEFASNWITARTRYDCVCRMMGAVSTRPPQGPAAARDILACWGCESAPTKWARHWRCEAVPARGRIFSWKFRQPVVQLEVRIEAATLTQ